MSEDLPESTLIPIVLTLGQIASMVALCTISLIDDEYDDEIVEEFEGIINELFAYTLQAQKEIKHEGDFSIEWSYPDMGL